MPVMLVPIKRVRIESSIPGVWVGDGFAGCEFVFLGPYFPVPQIYLCNWDVGMFLPFDASDQTRTIRSRLVLAERC